MNDIWIDIVLGARTPSPHPLKQKSEAWNGLQGKKAPALSSHRLPRYASNTINTLCGDDTNTNPVDPPLDY